MEKQELKKRIIDIQEDIQYGDDIGNDHNERKELRQKYDEIVDELLKLCDK